jgi:hypothetical protein
VLILGERLVEAHYRLIHELRIVGMKKEEWIDGVRSAVEELDESWLLYEKVRQWAI